MRSLTNIRWLTKRDEHVVVDLGRSVQNDTPNKLPSRRKYSSQLPAETHDLSPRLPHAHIVCKLLRLLSRVSVSSAAQYPNHNRAPLTKQHFPRRAYSSNHQGQRSTVPSPARPCPLPAHTDCQDVPSSVSPTSAAHPLRSPHSRPLNPHMRLAAHTLAMPVPYA